MAEQSKGERGERGIPGPPGPAGPRGQTGATGPRGHDAHVPSEALTDAARMEILTVVQEQIEEIYSEMDVQMRRMAQLQVQVDDLRSKMRKLTGT